MDGVPYSSRMERRRVILHLGGAESCFAVYCNGHEIGWGKDSRLPTEFDLTPALVRGRNVLAIKVIRWSDGSYLETGPLVACRYPRSVRR